MSEPIPGPTFFHRYFTPENRLAEVICGLIMVLSFTAATGGSLEDTTPHALLIAILGCNIAWGVVDGATYVLGNLLNRGARARLVLALQRDRRDPAAIRALEVRVESMLGELLDAGQRAQVRQWILDRVDQLAPERVRIRRDDLYTGLACFLIVVGSALPVLVPFLLIRDETIALRASNAVTLALLFAVGWRWAKFANLRPLATGLSLLAIGGLLVIITVLLGG